MVTHKTYIHTHTHDTQSTRFVPHFQSLLIILFFSSVVCVGYLELETYTPIWQQERVTYHTWLDNTTLVTSMYRLDIYNTLDVASRLYRRTLRFSLAQMQRWELILVPSSFKYISPIVLISTKNSEKKLFTQWKGTSTYAFRKHITHDRVTICCSICLK